MTNNRPSAQWEREALEADQREEYEIRNNLVYECEDCGSNNPHCHRNTCGRGVTDTWDDEYVDEAEDLVLTLARYAS